MLDRGRWVGAPKGSMQTTWLMAASGLGRNSPWLELVNSRVVSVNGPITQPSHLVATALNSNVQGLYFCWSELPLSEHLDRILINELESHN